MADKFRKLDKEYVLSDSTVNCYGYRLLTAGYQLTEFAKNPVGYYMHDRDGGVVLRWEDLRIENDCIYAKPCINLCNSRGQQTLDEAAAGFLNAASVGHIVVLEYSIDSSDMLPGQTGPTVTKWYNRECSLVDIPGNSNALTNLYDEDGNEWLTTATDNSTMAVWAANLKLKTDIGSAMTNKPNLYNMNETTLQKELAGILMPGANADTNGLVAALQQLKAEAAKVPGLEQKVSALEAANVTREVENILEQAFGAKKITRELKAKLANDYANNPAALKELVNAMPAYQSIADLIHNRAGGAGPAQDEGNWKWEDYEKNDPSGNKLKSLMSNNPVHYKQLFDARFLGEKA